MLTELNLYQYQARAVQHIWHKPKCALWLDMSLGKTIITLTALSKLLQYSQVKRVLVIAPLRVVNSVWQQEATKWEHTKHLTFCNISGGWAERMKVRSNEHCQIFLINKDTVTSLVKEYAKSWIWDMIVIDESSNFKNPASKRFKALRKVTSVVKRVVELTGTPAANGYHELWSQMYLLDKGERLGRTLTAYRQSYFQPNYNGFGYELRSKEFKNDIHDRLKDIILSMRAEDYLELPTIAYIESYVKLDTNTRRTYESLEKDFICVLEDDETVSAINAAVLQNKLIQTCNGAMYDDNKNVVEIHSEKLDQLEELIEEANGSPVLVGYTYRHDIWRIKQRFPQAVELDKNSATIDKWNRGEIPMLLAHPASAGHGLNLQQGGNILIWFGIPWSLELYQQFNARLHRQGQQKPTVIYHLICENTVEEKVLKVLNNKEAGQTKLLDALKVELCSKLNNI